MLMTKTIILGNGLSALIWAAYHPNSIIIGPGQIGGMIGNMKGPFFLHKHPSTEALLKKLGLSTETRTIKIGYAYAVEGSSEVYDNPPEGFREAYYRHSRCLNHQAKIPDSIMNRDTGNFEAFKITGEKLIGSLMNYIESDGCIIFDGKIETIERLSDQTKIRIGNSSFRTIHTNIISTIPAIKFYGLVMGSGDIITPKDTLTKIFVKAPDYKKDLSMYDFIYFCPPEGRNPGLTRLNNNKVTQESFWEYTYPGVGREIDTFFSEFLLNKHGKGEGISYHHYMSVRKDLKLKGYRGIKFLGRGAQWDHSIKVQDVVREAITDAEQ